MPTYARKHQLSDSLVYHVYNRSNSKLPIFRSVEDYRLFKNLLLKYGLRFSVKFYHWIIMQNHFHLLLEIETPEELSKMMAGIALSYTHYFHRKYETVGYLWQGRFKSQAVQKELYMIACGRYIERNPVKAGIAMNAWEYGFSSAQFYCSGIDDGITSEDPGFNEYGRDDVERRLNYRKFLGEFDAGLEKQFDEMKQPVGDIEFSRRLIRIDGRLVSRRRGKQGSIISASYLKQ